MTEKQLQQLADLLRGESSKKLALCDAWNNFISTSVLNCRPDTISYYKHQWNYATTFFKMNNIVYLNEISNNTLTSLQIHFKNKGYSNSSINKFTDIIKIVYKFNYDHDFISSNPIRDFKKLKSDTPETITIQDDIRTKILNYLDTLDDNNIFNLRDKLIIYILDETGVRLSELLNIKSKNVQVSENTIYLEYTKTGKPRDVYFSDKTKRFIQAYISRINPNLYFFQNLVDNKRMTKVSVYKFINHLKTELSIKQSISPHKWRHTLATNLMNNKLPIKEVQNVLGHTQLTTTQRYLHEDKRKTKKDVLNVLTKS